MMYALIQETIGGLGYEQGCCVLGVSADKTKLQAVLKEKVENFIREVWGDDEDDWSGCVEKPTDNMDFWSDEDDECETTFRIEKVEEF